jgi:hypothetical protein
MVAQSTNKYCMTAKRQDQQHWFDELSKLVSHHSDDPYLQALYAQGLMTAWLSRLALHDRSIQREIEERKNLKGIK